MSDQLTRIADQLMKLTDVVSSQAVTLGRMDERLGFYNNQLEIHIKRTEQNEAAIEKAGASIDARLTPIETHVKKVRATINAGKWAAGLVIPAIVAAALKYVIG